MTRPTSSLPLEVEPKDNGLAVIPQPTPTSILELAVKQGANIETLTQLLTLQERWEANEARKAFQVAFAAFKAEAPKIEKSKEVDFTTKSGIRVHYKYAPLDKIAEIVGPVLAKHGLSYGWKQTQAGGLISVTCILKHVKGHEDSSTLEGPPDDSGSKNSLQAIKAAVSYLRRGTVEGVLGIATSDEDTDGMTMDNGLDFIANIETAMNSQELDARSKEAIAAAYKAKDPKAAKLFMEARNKRAKEIAA